MMLAIAKRRYSARSAALSDIPAFFVRVRGLNATARIPPVLTIENRETGPNAPDVVPPSLCLLRARPHVERPETAKTHLGFPGSSRVTHRLLAYSRLPRKFNISAASSHVRRSLQIPSFSLTEGLRTISAIPHGTTAVCSQNPLNYSMVIISCCAVMTFTSESRCSFYRWMSSLSRPFRFASRRSSNQSQNCRRGMW